jgi:hypothetical protein
MTLSYNDRVVVHGLKSAAVQHLNGKTGTIVVVDTEAERYGIKIDGEEGPGVRCKMANLRVLEDPAPVPRNKRKEAAAAALRMAESFQRQMRLSTDQKQADECGCKALQLLERSRELFEEEEQTGDAKTYDRILEEARELEENDPCNTEYAHFFARLAYDGAVFAGNTDFSWMTKNYVTLLDVSEWLANYAREQLIRENDQGISRIHKGVTHEDLLEMFKQLANEDAEIFVTAFSSEVMSRAASSFVAGGHKDRTILARAKPFANLVEVLKGEPNVKPI